MIWQTGYYKNIHALSYSVSMEYYKNAIINQYLRRTPLLQVFIVFVYCFDVLPFRSSLKRNNRCVFQMQNKCLHAAKCCNLQMNLNKVSANENRVSLTGSFVIIKMILYAMVKSNCFTSESTRPDLFL